jgi:hypothetical protein
VLRSQVDDLDFDDLLAEAAHQSHSLVALATCQPTIKMMRPINMRAANKCFSLTHSISVF